MPDTPQGQAPGGAAGAGAGTEGEPRLFTQEQVNEINTREKRAARQAAERELADQLGCTVEEAKAKLKAADDAAAAQLSEAERREKAAADREAAAAKVDAEAKEATLNAQISIALARAQANPDSIEDAIVLVRRRGVTTASDADALGEAVTSLKEAMPALFDNATAPPARTPGTNPTPPRKASVPTGTWGQAGLDEAKRRGFVKQPA